MSCVTLPPSIGTDFDFSSDSNFFIYKLKAFKPVAVAGLVVGNIGKMGATMGATLVSNFTDPCAADVAVSITTSTRIGKFPFQL
jgi:hypothetical protein